MNPLSIFAYYTRNKRKALPVLGILALAVFGISLSLVLTGTIFDGVRGFVSPYYKFVVVQPNYNKKFSEIDPGLRAEIRRNPHLAASFAVQTQYVYGPILGIPQNFPLFAVSDDLLAPLLAVTETYLLAGRLPVTHADEVVLHASIAKTRGLWLGAQIGRDVNRDDPLAGKWTVVGILGGDTVLNLAPLARVARDRPARQLLLIPRPGEMGALSADLDALASEKVVIQTPRYWNQFIDRVLGQYDTLVNSINIVIVSVLSLGVGLLNVIYFRQRIAEFGLLAGIGYNRAFLVRRVTLEALLLTTVAWLVGMGLSIAVYQISNLLIFEPQGTTLSILSARMLLGTLPVPIFVWLFSTATVVWQVTRLDPVAVIERRD